MEKRSVTVNEEYVERCERNTNQVSASSDAASARIKKEFPTQQSFLRKFNAFTEQKKPLYRNDFDQFLTDLYGEADDDSPTW